MKGNTKIVSEINVRDSVLMKISVSLGYDVIFMLVKDVELR
jgi:hypothetical protein